MFHDDILLIDDSEAFCKSIKELMEDKGYGLVYVTDAQAGLQFVEEKDFKVILLDIRMPNMSGLDFLKELERRGLTYKNYVIVLTGEITIENAVESLRLGAKDFIQKHAVVEYPDLFFERIEKGFEWQEKRLENERLAEERNRAIEESRLIVKSVGHDMSGSYYASVMLRLKTLTKHIESIKNKIEECFKNLESAVGDKGKGGIASYKNEILKLVDESIQRSESISTLMVFFKELGEKLKELGQAIDITSKHKKEVDLNYLVKEAIHLYMDSRLAENPEVKVVENYSSKPLKVEASEEDILRVFVNLIENAYKAMDGKGILTARTYSTNGFAVVEISDTGCGIPKDKLEHIWRPDYTNWKGKQGTGLGLMICKKAVENHGGSIEVESEVNKGTTFRLKFKLKSKGENHGEEKDTAC
ncbi:MAG: hypothetical protein DRP91_02970 [Candidatus Neomarinimicrobiota bacterium]|nr:response regulator [Candidatus Neomarinimicrobiota bacterium]RKY49945.1 MAG: hypothetical protein DRP91_02970 [Candidatus Neomarinimicrobiota bacterium]